MSTFWNAIKTGYAAFKDGYFTPSNNTDGYDFTEYHLLFSRNWQIYCNTAFENLAVWQRYMRDRGLYKKTRILYNPMKRKVEFYAGRVYPGRLSLDGKEFPDGVRLAIPFPSDTDPKLKEAIAQIWNWSNWQTKMRLMVRYGSVAGIYILEIADYLAEGRVKIEPLWGEQIKKVELDNTGRLSLYELEYPVTDDDGQQYSYGKRVTRDGIEFFKDGQPFDYGNGEAYDNPYPFIPAVYGKHKDMGGILGADCFFGDYPRLEEVNSLATNGLDSLHKNLNPPIVIWSNSKITNALAEMDKRSEMDADNPKSMNSKIDTPVLRGQEGGRIDWLVGKMAVTETLAQCDAILKAIEADNPELIFWEKLREMQTVTGPGARALVGDVEGFFDEPCANYDAASAEAFVKAVAMAGWRFDGKQGGWALRTDQQMKFQPFGFDGYTNEKMDITILPRPLLEFTREDELELLNLGLDAAGKAEGIFPLDKRQEIAGEKDPDEREKMRKEMANEDLEFTGGSDDDETVNRAPGNDPKDAKPGEPGNTPKPDK